MFANIRDNQLVILGDEFGYVVEDTRVSGGGGGLVGLTAHAIANRKHGCRFIVGDNIRYWQEKAVLHVLDVDGKECRTDILRQERLRPSPALSTPLRSPAEEGNADAQFRLASAYLNGEGVPRDNVRAYMWLTIAASRATGPEQKIYLEVRDSTARIMTSQQIAEAQRLAREWKPSTK